MLSVKCLAYVAGILGTNRIDTFVHHAKRYFRIRRRTTVFIRGFDRLLRDFARLVLLLVRQNVELQEVIVWSDQHVLRALIELLLLADHGDADENVRRVAELEGHLYQVGSRFQRHDSVFIQAESFNRDQGVVTFVSAEGSADHDASSFAWLINLFVHRDLEWFLLGFAAPESIRVA